MAGSRGGELPSLEREGGLNEKPEEPSEGSASLLEVVSQSMEEVVYCAPLTPLDGDMLELNATGNADSEGELSGEDGSLFEEVDRGDESHFGALGGAEESTCGRASNGHSTTAFVNYSLRGGIRFQTEDVPFISASRGNLDGPLDGPLVSLQRVDGSSLDTLSLIFDDLRSKEICAPGGQIGEGASLADLNLVCQPDSITLNEEEVQTECMPEIVEGLVGTGNKGTPQTLAGIGSDEDLREVDIRLDSVASDPVGALQSKSLQEGARKKGRASRELGALLMDARGSGRGKKASGVPEPDSDAFALAIVRGTTEAAASVGGVLAHPSEGVASRVEVRVTRSKASGQLAGMNENLAASSLDMKGKATGKRSAARGGRLGWGNVVESCTDGVLTCGEDVMLHNIRPDEGNTVQGVEIGQAGRAVPSKGRKNPDKKSVKRAQKAGGKKKVTGTEREEALLGGPTSILMESYSDKIIVDTAQDVRDFETPSHFKEISSTVPTEGSNQHDDVCCLDGQEAEPLESSTVLEPNARGRRQSTRHKDKASATAGTDQQLQLLCLGSTSRISQRKSAVKKTVPVIVSEVPAEDQEICGTTALEGSLRTCGQNGNDPSGDPAVGEEIVESFKDMPSKGRKSAKGKNGRKRGVQTRGRKSQLSSDKSLPSVDGSSGRFGDEQPRCETIPDTELTPENVKNSPKRLRTEETLGFSPEKTTGTQEGIGGECCLAKACGSQGTEDFGINSGEDERILPAILQLETDASRAPVESEGRHNRTEEGMGLKTKDMVLGKEEATGQPPDARPEDVVKHVDRVKSEVGKLEDSFFMKDGGADSAVTCGPQEIQDRGVKGEETLVEVTFSIKDEGNMVTGLINAEEKEAVKVSAVTSGESTYDQAEKLNLENTRGSQVVAKSKDGGKIRGGHKKESAAALEHLAALEDAATETTMKPKTSSKKGTGKVNSESSVVAELNDDSILRGVDHVKIKVDADTTEPPSCSCDRVEMPENNAKRRLSGSSNTLGAVDVAKKRQHIGTLQNPLKNDDPCTSAILLNPDDSGGIDPFVSVAKVKASQGGKTAKPSEKVIRGKKDSESTKVNRKSKRVIGTPRLAARSNGGTVKALSSIKDQAGEAVLSRVSNSTTNSGGGKFNSEVLEVSANHPSICRSTKASGLVTEEATVGSPSLNKESSKAGDGTFLRPQTAPDCQGMECVKDLDSGAVGEDLSSGVTEGGENKGSEKCIDSAVADASTARKSWALCDDCNKWRCIPVELADEIESTNARWSCRENPDEGFRDCMVPQEKSNAEINAELEISEVSVCDEGDDKDAADSKSMNLGVDNEDNRPAVWKQIRRNIFQHRRRKVLEIDEAMVCQCTPGEKGEVGCGDNCLNRMLSIECVAEQCPCGDACSNQQFQNRTYAPIETYRCGKKGFGLRVTKKVTKGTFIIEYVGEVLDVGAFEGRQQEYARKGQKHFYFMTLNTNEVIDACSKGNFGRFINHSCEPNCATEKWMVNGEVCIGLFAVRDIAQDEEVTFDYNYVRVCGAAAKKCECGSAHCRGFIGGDPLTPKAVVESDSEDDEDLEPIMLENSEDEDNYVKENKRAPCKKPRDEREFRETTTTRISGIKRKLVPTKGKAPSFVKRFKSAVSAKKSFSVPHKGLMVGVSCGRPDGSRAIYSSDVQEKLDDMLDRKGGLKKKRDAAKQYLKLLVLTSASGDNRRDATACSVRDLSLLLEALLKTTSRTVLTDLINKNGLRMLHNLIKQLRRQWEKTPILRKLIRVLDLLAKERVLTKDLINSGPPCSGMESFSESLFELTRHKDSEVVGMARSFRNRWMPPRSQHYDQSFKGHEKAFQAHSMQTSPATMQQSDQLNMGPSRYHISHNVKQVSPRKVAAELETLGPSSCGPSAFGGGSTRASCTPIGPAIACSMESSISKCNTQGTEKPVVTGAIANTGEPDQLVKKPRRRPSRWDAPAKFEKNDQDPVHAIDSDGQVAVPSFSTTQGLAFPVHLQSEGPKVCHGNMIPMHPKYQSSHSLQQGPPESSGLQLGIRSPTASLRQPRHGGPLSNTQASAGIASTFVTTGTAAPAVQMQMCPPRTSYGPSQTQAGLQQMSAPNHIQVGGPPLPTGAYPGCPPSQMGSVASAPQGMHGVSPQVPIGAYPFPVGYPLGPPMPPMPPAPPYTQWGPPAGSPHFPIRPYGHSQSHSLQPMWPVEKVDDVAQRWEPEPPVPGLSPFQAQVQVGCRGSDGLVYSSFQDMSRGQSHQRQKGWNNYVSVRGREDGCEYYGPGDADTREETGSYHLGECWDTPEADGFRDDVFAMVNSQVQKHKLKTRDLDRFCSKLADVIVRKEVAKYIEHKNQGSEKIILKSKLVEKVESYVDKEVEVYARKMDRSHRS